MKLTHRLRPVTYLTLSILLIGSQNLGCGPFNDTPSPNDINYTVQVQAAGSGEDIQNANVRLDLAGKAPLRTNTDVDGFARICIDDSCAGQPARLTVTAPGYADYVLEIDVLEGLPAFIQLQKQGTLAATPTKATSISPSPTVSTPSPSATPVPIVCEPYCTATAKQDAGIFGEPNAESEKLGGVVEGEQVCVLGRSAIGRWLYIRDNQVVKGFVYAPWFNWQGDYESLPVIETTTPSAHNSPTPPVVKTYCPPLTMSLWENPGTGQCSDGGVWDKSIYICGHGGDGNYTYYWNGEIVGGPTSDNLSFNVHSVDAAIIGIGKVVSGDGQVVEQELYVHVPDCAK